MTLLFAGHGSPMNAIEKNRFTENFAKISQKFPKPKRILAISAHSESRGIFVTETPKPPTIHDFWGFPRELYELNYPAKWSSELANEVAEILQDFGIQKDDQHGLDHGIWSVLVHVFPNEQIPISVLTLDINKSFSDHMKIAEKLTKFNTEDTLIFASGNIVHNLRAIDWDHMDDNFAFSWAKNVNDYLKENFYANNLEKLVNLPKNSEFSLAIPTRDHYLPFLYIAAMRAENSEIITFNDEIVGGSISMTSFLVL